MSLIGKHITLLLLVISPVLSFANSTFQEGVEAFNDKNYSLAADKFDSIISISPNNISAYFNYGLAKMEVKRYGDAIWAFEKVLKYNPTDAEAKEKIQECYFELNPNYFWNYRLNGFQSSLYSISANTWGILVIVFSLVLGISIILYKLKLSHSIRRMMLLIGGFSVLFILLSILFGSLSKSHASSDNLAIVISDVKSLKTRTSLEEGTLVEIIESKGEEIRIEIDGELVYVLGKDLKRI